MHNADPKQTRRAAWSPAIKRTWVALDAGGICWALPLHFLYNKTVTCVLRNFFNSTQQDPSIDAHSCSASQEIRTFYDRLSQVLTALRWIHNSPICRISSSSILILSILLFLGRPYSILTAGFQTRILYATRLSSSPACYTDWTSDRVTDYNERITKGEKTIVNDEWVRMWKATTVAHFLFWSTWNETL